MSPSYMAIGKLLRDVVRPVSSGHQCRERTLLDCDAACAGGFHRFKLLITVNHSWQGRAERCCLAFARSIRSSDFTLTAKSLNIAPSGHRVAPPQKAVPPEPNGYR